jgi:hypothetical protein
LALLENGSEAFLFDSQNCVQQLGDPYQATNVWVKERERWQRVAAHVSQVDLKL